MEEVPYRSQGGEETRICVETVEGILCQGILIGYISLLSNDDRCCQVAAFEIRLTRAIHDTSPEGLESL